MTDERAPRTVAIHQPNFLPWLGFFDKLARADVFVLLDSVQFPRTSKGTWINRVKLLVGGRPQWATVPIIRSDGSALPIGDVRIDDAQPWRKKLTRTIELNYRRAPAFDEVFPLVSELLATDAERIAAFNEQNVRRVAQALELDTGKIVRSSELDVDGRSTDLLIELTLAVGGTAYMPGGDAYRYQQDEKFAARGLELVPQDFVHPTYAQPVEPFMPGLSTVDALMNCGFGGTRGLLVSRRSRAASPS
ncbi:MAG TPA: WbqC family protein [Gaiellaceae bacterium]|nr:WbqC family protein [Gaiellaceae bacterium]